MNKIGRNKLCPCGSGKKSKRCCGNGSAVSTLPPVLAEQYNEQGNFLADQRMLNEAILCYQKALEIKPDFAGAWNNLGIVFKELRLLDKAISCYRKALEISPAFAGAHNNLGNALKEQGRQEEAIACYRHALAIDPGSVQANTNLGNILCDLGRYSPDPEQSELVTENHPEADVMKNSRKDEGDAVTIKLKKVEDSMKLDEIKEIAKQHNIKVSKMKKAELVRAIQQAEENDLCFETGQVDGCGQAACLWREDCA